MDLGLDLFFIQKKGGIEQAFPPLLGIPGRTADQNTDRVCFLPDLVNSCITFMDEIIELYKIPCRITTYTHFAEKDQITPLCFRFPDGTDDLLGVTFKVADMIILLC